MDPYDSTLTRLLSNRGEKSINLYFIMVLLRKTSIKVWYSKAQLRVPYNSPNNPFPHSLQRTTQSILNPKPYRCPHSLLRTRHSLGDGSPAAQPVFPRGFLGSSLKCFYLGFRVQGLRSRV